MTRLDLVAAGPAMAAVISALHGACFDPSGGPSWDEKAISDLLAMPGAFAFVATEEDIPLGFVIARRAADEAEIITIGTLPEARRQGVARALLDRTIETATADGTARIFLEVAADNPPALEFYQARNFRECGRRVGYYRRAKGVHRNAVDALVLVFEVAGGK